MAWNDNYAAWYWWDTDTRQTSWENRLPALELNTKTIAAAPRPAAVELRLLRADPDEFCDLYCATDWLEYVASLAQPRNTHGSDGWMARVGR